MQFMIILDIMQHLDLVMIFTFVIMGIQIIAVQILAIHIKMRNIEIMI